MRSPGARRNRTPLFAMTSTGRLQAQVLAGSWRAEPPPLEISSSQLRAVAPLLAGSGAGALAWRRLRDSPARDWPGADALRRAHFQQALDARVQEGQIEKYLLSLAEWGVEPLLVKGWDCARLHPEPGMRPFGDVDLIVRPEEAQVVSQALGVPVDASFEGSDSNPDVKTCLPDLYERGTGGMRRGERRVPVREAWARVLGDEERLRLVCLHFLRHGAWRPLWLCDIAAALEARPSDFNWARCLGTDARRASYVLCALGLAHQLLGARVEGTPAAGRAGRLPRWLVPAVLRAWEAPMVTQHHGRALFSSVPRRPGPLLRALAERWPNPVEVAVGWRLPLELHPLPAQALFYAGIYAQFVRERGWKRGARAGA